MLNLSSAIKWNTHRTYTEHGQRIAAVAIDRGVYFVDFDRGVSGFIPDCDLNQRAVMAGYDANRYTYVPPSLDGNEPGLAYADSSRRWNDFREMQSALERIAKQ